MIPLSTALLANNASLRGFERMRDIALVDAVAWKATRLGLILAALYLSYELYGVLIGYLARYVVDFSVSVWLLWRSMPAIGSIEFREVAGEVVDFAKPMLASRLFGRGRREVDTVFTGAFHPIDGRVVPKSSNHLLVAVRKRGGYDYCDDRPDRNLDHLLKVVGRARELRSRAVFDHWVSTHVLLLCIPSNRRI